MSMSAAVHRVKNVPRKNVPRKRRGSRTHRRDAIMQEVYSQRGLASRVAEHLGLSNQVVSAWKRVPAHHVLRIATLLELSPEQIRPDIFGEKRRR